jgi:hypothetical protein
MSNSIQIETINSYTKNTTNEVGNFPIATGAITNCPVMVNSVSSENLAPYLILEPINVPVIVPTPQIFGCTNPTAVNYNPLATIDDGSCLIVGCTNPNSINYNPDANIDNNNCIPKIYGCTDPSASNYNPAANVDNGTCTFYETFYGNFAAPLGITEYSPTGTWTVYCYLSGDNYYNFSGSLTANVYWPGTKTLNNLLIATLSNDGTTWNGYSIQTVNAIGYGGQGNWSWGAGNVGIGFAPNPNYGSGFVRMEPAPSLGHITYLVGIVPLLNYSS